MQVTEYRFEENRKMHGVKRVLVFCILIVILPATLIIMPLYLRRTVFSDVTYPVAESDIIEIRDGISSIFCQQHSLHMNGNFNAFQLRQKPEISTSRKHIRLKKSMTLPDDTLEYWGFYLLKGAKVNLKFCSRYDGSRILVVKGQRELKTCGLLDHNKNKLDANFAEGHEQVKVFFEDIAEIAATDREEHKDSDKLRTEEKSKQKKAVRPNEIGEIENHASEDLSDDGMAPALLLRARSGETATTKIPTVERGTKLPRKKLKKGSLHSLRNRKTEEPPPTPTPTPTPTVSEPSINTSRSLNIVNVTATNSSEQSLSSQLNDEETQSTRTRSRRHHSKRSLSPSSAASKQGSMEASGSDVEFELRHRSEHERRKQEVYDELYKQRTKREHVYDRKYSHGGNAVNFTETDESNSVSSFEDGLFQCYNGAILLAEGFPPSADCFNAHYLENGSHRMLTQHEVTEDGYYYYIFYSDNDLVRNDIHAIFDIYKPTFQYSNLSETPGCVNVTNCTFPINFLSDEIVIVEVPTRDGIEHEEDDITFLISTCHPRTEIYALFPITVLILILSCSFL